MAIASYPVLLSLLVGKLRGGLVSQRHMLEPITSPASVGGNVMPCPAHNSVVGSRTFEQSRCPETSDCSFRKTVAPNARSYFSYD